MSAENTSYFTARGISRRAVRIPREQSELIERPDAWHETLKLNPRATLSVPNQVLQDVKSAYSRAHLRKEASSPVRPTQASSPERGVSWSPSPRGRQGPALATQPSPSMSRDVAPASNGVSPAIRSQPEGLESEDEDIHASAPSNRRAPSSGGATSSSHESTPAPRLAFKRTRTGESVQDINNFPSSTIGSDAELEVEVPGVLEAPILPRNKHTSSGQTPPSAQVTPSTKTSLPSPAKRPPAKRVRRMKNLDWDAEDEKLASAERSALAKGEVVAKNAAPSSVMSLASAKEVPSSPRGDRSRSATDHPTPDNEVERDTGRIDDPSSAPAPGLVRQAAAMQGQVLSPILDASPQMGGPPITRAETLQEGTPVTQSASGTAAAAAVDQLTEPQTRLPIISEPKTQTTGMHVQGQKEATPKAKESTLEKAAEQAHYQAQHAHSHPVLQVNTSLPWSPSDRTSPFETYTAAYPEFQCKVKDFVRGCYYVSTIYPGGYIPTFVFDDVIRAFQEDYLDYVINKEPSSKPLPAIKWYNRNVEAPKYSKNIITRKNLQAVLDYYPKIRDELLRFAEPASTTVTADGGEAVADSRDSFAASEPTNMNTPLIEPPTKPAAVAGTAAGAAAGTASTSKPERRDNGGGANYHRDSHTTASVLTKSMGVDLSAKRPATEVIEVQEEDEEDEVGELTMLRSPDLAKPLPRVRTRTYTSNLVRRTPQIAPQDPSVPPPGSAPSRLPSQMPPAATPAPSSSLATSRSKTPAEKRRRKIQRHLMKQGFTGSISSSANDNIDRGA